MPHSSTPANAPDVTDIMPAGDRPALTVAEHSERPKRRRKYPPEKIIHALRETRGMIALAARALGCERNTIYDAAKRFPSVRRAIEDQRELSLDRAELGLLKAVQDGEGWATCFFLKTQGRGRGYIERQELTGPNGGPIQLEAVRLAEDFRGRILRLLSQDAGESHAG